METGAAGCQRPPEGLPELAERGGPGDLRRRTSWYPDSQGYEDELYCPAHQCICTLPGPSGFMSGSVRLFLGCCTPEHVVGLRVRRLRGPPFTFNNRKASVMEVWGVWQGAFLKEELLKLKYHSLLCDEDEADFLWWYRNHGATETLKPSAVPDGINLAQDRWRQDPSSWRIALSRLRSLHQAPQLHMCGPQGSGGYMCGPQRGPVNVRQNPFEFRCKILGSRLWTYALYEGAWFRSCENSP